MFKEKVSRSKVASLADKFRDFYSPGNILDSSTPINVNRNVFEFQGMVPKEYYGSTTSDPQYDSIAKHYGIDYKGDGERIAVLTNYDSTSRYPLGNPTQINLSGITSVDIAAAKKGKIVGTDGRPIKTPFENLAVIGGVFTSDDKLIVGTRGRRFGKELTPERVMSMADNCYALAPGGGATFSYSGDPLEQAMLHEAQEELALLPDQISTPRLVGLFNALKVGPTGLKFVYDLTTKASSSEVIYKHAQALERYNELNRAGADQKEVAIRLTREGFAPDVWEHSKLEALSLDEVVDRLETIRPIMSHPLENKVCGIGIGAIMTLLRASQ